MALTRARELGFETVACASTGNLANSVLPMPHPPIYTVTCSSPATLRPRRCSVISIYKPHVVEIEGNYDDVNRLCSEIAGEHGWALVISISVPTMLKLQDSCL